LQQRHLEYTYTGFDENTGKARKTIRSDFFNPKAGINYSPKENVQLYLFAGIGHKEPVRNDYINSTPKDSLVPEKMIDIEGGVKMQARKATFGVNLFYMYYDNQLILTGKVNDVGEYIRQNVQKSYRSGIEAEGEYKFSQRLYAKANATFSINKINTYREYVDDYDTWTQVVQEYKNTPIAFSPSITGYAALGFSIFKGMNAELCGKYIGDQYLDNTGNDARSLEGYFVSDLYLSYTLTPKKIKELTFRVSLFNLTNTEYSANGYTYSGYSGGVRYDYNSYYPQARMNVSGGVLVKL
jgi:iron complex outermembrane receptor protein